MELWAELSSRASRCNSILRALDHGVPSLLREPEWCFAASSCFIHLYTINQSINQSIGMNRMQWFLAVLRSLLHSSLLYTFSCHSSPPTILPSSLTSSSHLFLGLPLGLIVSKFMYNTLLGILFSSILCTCPNQRNLCSLIVSVIVGFLIFA